MKNFVPDVEDLEDRIVPSTPGDTNIPDTVLMSPLPEPTDDQTQGVSPGLGGSAGGAGDRGSPPGIVGD